MGKQVYLGLLIVSAILAQDARILSDDNSKFHIRRKRLIDRTPGGNRPTRIDQAPHIVSVHIDDTHICAGTILYDNVILVKAACIHEVGSHTYIVRSGTNRRDVGTPHTVLEVLYHPEYFTSDGDRGNLALLEITPPIDLIHSANRKISLYNRNVPPNTLSRTSGWGDNRLNRSRPIFLRTITVRTINTDDCRRLNGDDPDVTEAVICTYDESLQKHASEGDHSNPLYDLENRYLYGIMLWTTGHGHPDVYLNLNHHEYKAWIVPEIVRLASKLPFSRAAESRYAL